MKGSDQREYDVRHAFVAKCLLTYFRFLELFNSQIFTTRVSFTGSFTCRTNRPPSVFVHHISERPEIIIIDDTSV